ncbi:hypothetical protein P4O66_018730 [Electrophorus voltai]|uniref:Uncharacterized protein n=1 Tax=Electrophorus voltai TaxID=2609070 RepID=A0AAD8YSZ6_9TELE|nr:hypothetical protein P4O66_018730 [Electrophorus voltai]
MHRGISLQMTSERSRNKERLEASLTWLCELELLKQRQESLVLGALSLGDTVPGCPAWGDLQPARSAESGPSREQEDLTLRRQLNHLQGAPNGLMVVLQQQLGELRADACDHGADEDLDSPSSSDAYMLDWEAQRESPPRAALPRSFSAPYPPLEGIAEGTEEEDDDEDGVVNGEPINGPETGPADEGVSVEAEVGSAAEADEGPTAEDIQQALRVEAYILGLLQRCSIGAPASSSAGLTTSNHWPELHPYPSITPSYCNPPPNHSEWQEWSALGEEEDGGEDSQGGYYMSHLEAKAEPSSLGCEDAESSLEMEPYGAREPRSSSQVDSLQHQRGYLEHRPAALDSRGSHYIRTCVSPPLTPEESVEEEWAPRSLEQEPPRPLPRMHQEEWWTSAREMHPKTASRSQSEGSFPPRGWSVQSEHRYHTVGRGTGGDRADEDYLSKRRLWSSSADLSQEEEEPALRGEEHMHAHIRPPCHTFPHAYTQYSDQAQRQGAGLSGRVAQADGSDSSLSETCSPGSSSVSSDSDESGGLVWPQRLPPRLPPSSQSTPGAVVKVKASHALKRKILRFRSSSLKVMTTV